MSTSSPDLQSRTYPPELRVIEDLALNDRRRRNNQDLKSPVVGVALSGGGIRSATFCLGLFQAIARQRLLGRIDILSTVSGGGYFGSFLGAAFSREKASVESIERELANNHSWSVKWLRENGRFLSPNGAGDNWLTAATALRNWAALQVVLLTFTFLILGLGALVRADLCCGRFTRDWWNTLELYFWQHPVFQIWWSPWLILPVIPFALLMVPTGTVYWLTQWLPLMGVLRDVLAVMSKRVRAMSDAEFRGRAQHSLTRVFMIGFALSVTLLGFAIIDSLGQSAYLHWSANDFVFPALWAALTAAGTAAFGFGTKVAILLEKLLGTRARIPSKVIALGLSLTWATLLVTALSVIACGFAWNWGLVWTGEQFQTMSGGWGLTVAVAVCFAASWFFSRAFGFVNLSSLQQIYAARLSRAYLGASNPERQQHENHSMTDLMAGDDFDIDQYAPHRQGGPLHLINVTVNETISGRTNIERRDRKGLALAIGPCGLSVGIDSHALWSEQRIPSRGLARLHMLWETRRRGISPIACTPDGGRFHALCDTGKAGTPSQAIEALSLGRWIAVSGAAFTTGTGSHTSLGLSLLLGLGNVRLGYWWDSGIEPTKSSARSKRPTFVELASRIISMVLPVQSCLMNEFFARFHGPARRHWYLSDGGHFENTACYELLRRRVPFIICSDAGQDPKYEFADFANLVRKARIDFGAEIQVVRRRSDISTDDPGVRCPMPKLEDLVHPNLLDVIGTPEEFAALHDDPEKEEPPVQSFAKCHAVLARIHYLDTDEFGWLLLIKPSLMGDEAADVLQYQRTKRLFPQEPTSDQYFDEAQWESYRKLGEHIGTELFTAPSGPAGENGATWSPSKMCGPVRTTDAAPALAPSNLLPEIRELHPRMARHAGGST